MAENYEDIINLPHHISKKHRPMPREARAAQFAPFAALTGYESDVNEAARSMKQSGSTAVSTKYGTAFTVTPR